MRLPYIVWPPLPAWLTDMHVHRMTRLGAILLLAFSSAVSFADQEEVAEPTTVEELLAAIEELAAEREIPSVGLAIVNEAGPVWVGAIGKADVENDIDADEHSLYRIGSTSKMFVSLAVLKLVEEGKLSLDDKLSDLAPEVEFSNDWEETDPIRVVHLLEHTTGWDDIHLAEYAHNEYPPVSLLDGLAFHPHSRQSRWIPGTRSSYCNAGPPVAARIVENVTGQEFEQYVIDNFFEPMGMETATYRYSDEVQANGVTLYIEGEPQEYWHIIMRPSGAINASPADMAKLAMFFVNRGTVGDTQLISPESITRMERAASTSGARAGQEIGYGLSNYTSIHDTFVFHGHDGGVNGGLTEFAYLPEGQVAHVIMVNSGDFEGYRRISDLVRAFEVRNLDSLEARAAVPVSDSHREIQGFYHPINSRQQISYFLDRVFGIQNFWFQDGKLFQKPVMGGETATYLPVSEQLFMAEESGAVNLSYVEDPLVGTVLHLGTLVLKPVPAVVVYGQLLVAFLWAISILTAIPYFLVWGARRMRGKIPPGPTISVRLWPLLASLSVIGFVVGVATGMNDPFRLLGAPTAASIAIMSTTTAFFLFAMFGVYTVHKERDSEMNRANYWYCAVTSVAHFLVALYLLNFGVIGLMTWA